MELFLLDGFNSRDISKHYAKAYRSLFKVSSGSYMDRPYFEGDEFQNLALFSRRGTKLKCRSRS